MGSLLDTIPNSGIVGSGSSCTRWTAPSASIKGRQLRRARHDEVRHARGDRHDQTHYLQTAGLPALKELLAAKLRARNGVPVTDAEEVL